MKQLLTIFYILGICAIDIHAQELIVPLTSNPIQQEEAARRSTQRITVSIGDTLQLPSGTSITDDFSYDSYRPDTVLWDLSALQPDGSPTGVFVNRTWAYAPVDVGLCTFDGLKFDGLPYNAMASPSSTILCDYLTSNYFDLQTKTAADSIYIRFFWQAKGRGYAPNANDSFQLQVNYPAIANDWETIWFKTGYNPATADTNFHWAMVRLDNPAFFANGFRFRFRNYASPCGSNDHWHLDQVSIRANSNRNDTLVGGYRYAYEPGSLIRDFRSIPWWHYDASLMAGSQRLFIRNNTNQGTTISTSNYTIRFSNGSLHYSSPLAAAALNFLPYPSIGFYQDPGGAQVWNPTIASAAALPTMSAPSFFTTDYSFQAGLLTDTVRSENYFNNYYAYDDGTAEVGYGLNGANSLLAYRFTLPSSIAADTLEAVQMYFLPVQDIDDLQFREFKLTIWSHNTVSNEPGTIIYQEDSLNPIYMGETVNRFATYRLSQPQLLSGTFYIGWQQLAQDRLYIGFDFNSDQSDKIYYNTNGTWYTSIFDGALMMRPLFRSTDDLSGIEQTDNNNSITVFPNPATDQIQIKGLVSGINYTVQLIDMTGRILVDEQIQSPEFQVSDFPEGIYLLRLYNRDNGLQFTQRIIITR